MFDRFIELVTKSTISGNTVYYCIIALCVTIAYTIIKFKIPEVDKVIIHWFLQLKNYLIKLTLNVNHLWICMEALYRDIRGFREKFKEQ